MAIQQKEKETEEKGKACKLAIRRKTEALLQANRTDRNQEQKFDLELIEFLDEPQVAEVFCKYQPYLEKYYKFYSSQGKIVFGYDMQFQMDNMHQKEFVSFGFQAKIAPVLITSEQLMQIFRFAAKSQQEELITEGSAVKDKNTIQFISFESFKKALVRICIYAHDKLGGKNKQQEEYAKSAQEQQQQFDERLRQLNKRKEIERKQITEQVQAEMRKEFNEFQQKSMDLLNRKEVLTKARQEQEYERWVLQQNNLQNGLKERVQQKLVLFEKPIAQKLNKLGSGSARATLKKQYDQLDILSKQNELALKEDLRDNTVVIKPAMDVKLISHETVENLMQYLNLSSCEEIARINRSVVPKKSKQNKLLTHKSIVEQQKDEVIQEFDQNERNEQSKYNEAEYKNMEEPEKQEEKQKGWGQIEPLVQKKVEPEIKVEVRPETKKVQPQITVKPIISPPRLTEDQINETDQITPKSEKSVYAKMPNNIREDEELNQQLAGYSEEDQDIQPHDPEGFFKNNRKALQIT